MNLKNLYQYLVVDNQYKWNGWHHEYKIILEAVSKIKEQLKNGASIDEINYKEEEIVKLKEIGRNTEVTDYNSLLQLLLYDKDNGVSSRGQSTLSETGLCELQNDDTFKQYICNAIKDPSNDNCKIIIDYWSGLVKEERISRNNPLLVNRFIAACNDNISSLVNEDQLNHVCEWLNDENIYQIDCSGTWFEKNQKLIKIFKDNLEPHFQSPQYDIYWRNMFPWIIFDNMANKFQMKKNIVKYGPPGTGKTFQAKSISNIQFNIWKDFYADKSDFTFEDHIETVQFHQSYTYEEFIEGLRPKLNASGVAQLSLQNGIFKNFYGSSNAVA